MENGIEDLIGVLPKAELHLHIEGTLEPTLLLALADRNKITLPYANEDEVRAAYEFQNLQDFLDIYYTGADVLRTEEDFYALAWRYLNLCREQNIVHTEMMFDPQTHLDRGIPFAVVIDGLTRAMQDARQQWGQSSLLIMCFLRHLSAESAMQVIDHAEHRGSEITAVGLDSGEAGNPPEKFTEVFKRCRALGWRCVAHAGEEGPPSYIWGALNALQAERIDHGVRCDEEPSLVEYLVSKQVPLTVCPLSNVKLKVFDRMESHNAVSLLSQGVRVTINSDDPAYFGGYLNENFQQLISALGLSRSQLITLIENSFTASFLPDLAKREHLRALTAALA